jgi:hypothetical protein
MLAPSALDERRTLDVRYHNIPWHDGQVSKTASTANHGITARSSVSVNDDECIAELHRRALRARTLRLLHCQFQFGGGERRRSDDERRRAHGLRHNFNAFYWQQFQASNLATSKKAARARPLHSKYPDELLSERRQRDAQLQLSRNRSASTRTTRTAVATLSHRRDT